MQNINTDKVKLKGSGSGQIVLESNSNRLLTTVSSSSDDTRSSIDNPTVYFGKFDLKTGIQSSGSSVVSGSYTRVDEKLIVSGSTKGVISEDGTFSLGTTKGSGTGQMIVGSLYVSGSMGSTSVSGGFDVSGSLNSRTELKLGNKIVGSSFTELSGGTWVLNTKTRADSYVYVTPKSGFSYIMVSQVSASHGFYVSSSVAGILFDWLLVNPS